MLENLIFTPVVVSAFVLAIGLCFGSFATLMIHRLPKNLPVMYTSSKCPKCGKKLGFWDLFPLFSWLFSKGKCSGCGKKISIFYPATELITGLVFLAIYFKFDLTFTAAALSLIAVFLIIIIGVDLEHKIIPDAMQLCLLVMAVFYWLDFYLENGGVPWLEIFGGCVFGITVAIVLRYIFFRLKGMETLGLGDVKFFAVSGLFIGVSGMPLYLMISGFLGCLFGLLWKKIKGEDLFPFGPALAFTLFIMLYFPGMSENLISYISIIYLNI